LLAWSGHSCPLLLTLLLTLLLILFLILTLVLDFDPNEWNPTAASTTMEERRLNAAQSHPNQTFVIPNRPKAR
jgi:hypothetical protein